MAELSFSPMGTEDIPAVAEIEKNSFSMPWSESSFSEMLEKKDAPYLTAKQDGIVIGYVGSCIVGDEAYINQIAVREDKRGEGVGTDLLRAYCRLLTLKGVRAVTLEVRISNLAAIRMYEAVGFKTEGVRRDFYERPVEDALILWKTDL